MWLWELESESSVPLTTVCPCQWSSPVNPMKRVLSCSWSPVIPWSSLENMLGHMTCWSPLQSSLLPSPAPLFSLFSLLPHRRAPCCTVIVITLLGQFPPRVIIIFLSLHVLPPVSQNSSEARSLSWNLSCINSKENVLRRRSSSLLLPDFTLPVVYVVAQTACCQQQCRPHYRNFSFASRNVFYSAYLTGDVTHLSPSSAWPAKSLTCNPSYQLSIVHMKRECHCFLTRSLREECYLLGRALLASCFCLGIDDYRNVTTPACACIHTSRNSDVWCVCEKLLQMHSSRTFFFMWGLVVLPLPKICL